MFWDCVKNLCYSNHITTGNISKVQWEEHLKTFYNPKLLAERLHYCEPFIEVNEMDIPFIIDEIESALEKTEGYIVPGLDRIPYEFYKHTILSF